MRKYSKFIVILAVILVCIMIPQISFATVDKDISTWNFNTDPSLPTPVANIVGWVVRFLRNISVIITIVVITILGIKYMIGSVQQKAEYKKDYINILIGVIMVTLITSIVDAIFSITQNLV